MQDAAIKPFFVARRCSGREANGSPRERGQLYLARRDLLRAPFGAIAVRCRRGSFRHAVVIVASRAAVAILHQAMNVGLEAGKLLVEIAREFRIADDGGVEALTRNQQLVARRISTAGCTSAVTATRSGELSASTPPQRFPLVIVAMTLFAWRRDQCRKTVEQLHWRQHQTDASSRTGASSALTPDVRDRRPQVTPSRATVPAQRPDGRNTATAVPDPRARAPRCAPRHRPISRHRAPPRPSFTSRLPTPVLPTATLQWTVSAGRRSHFWLSARRYPSMRLAVYRRRCSKRRGSAADTASR